MLILSLSSCTKSNDSEITDINNNTSSAGKTETTAELTSRDEIQILSLEKVKQIAWDYWQIEPGSTDPDTGFPFSVFATLDGNVYHVSLSWLVDNHHYSTVDKIDIDARSGEVLIRE